MKKSTQIITILSIALSLLQLQLNAQTCTTTPLPYYETFNAPLALGQIPDCSTNETLLGYGEWKATTNGFSNTQCLGSLSDYPQYRNSMLWITPKFNLSNANSYRISFYYKSVFTDASIAPILTVLYGNCQQNSCINNYISGGTEVVNTTFIKSTVIFTPVTTGIAYIGFKTLEKYDNPSLYAPVYLDDIKLEDLGPLDAPASALTGIATTSATKLFWQTYTESNNQGFEIQQSTDGNTFTKIGFMPSKAGNGNSNLPINYEFAMPPLAATHYYRYKQLDKDGKTTFSNIILINANSIAPKQVLKIITNPVKNIIKASTLSATNQQVLITVTDNTGRKLITKNIQLNTGYNNTDIDIGNISNGYYYLSLYNNQSQLLMAPVSFLKQ